MWSQTLKAGVLYFTMVFGAGFVLGVVRELFLVRLVGIRITELVELPVMLAIALFSARWLVQRFALSHTVRHRLGMGIIALALLLIGELAVAVGLRGLPLSDAFVSRDAVSGTAYRIALGLFALMPLFVVRR